LATSAFHFDGGSGNVNEPTAITLGDFHATGVNQTINDTFTLTISQTLPGVGSNSILATIAGTVTTNSSGVFIDFGGPSPFLPGSTTIIAPAGVATTYQAFDTFLVPSTTLTTSGLGVTTVQGFVSTVPLPATANMGFGLIVCVAGAGIWRKRKSGQAALD